MKPNEKQSAALRICELRYIFGELMAVSSDRSNSGRWNHGFLKH